MTCSKSKSDNFLQTSDKMMRAFHGAVTWIKFFLLFSYLPYITSSSWMYLGVASVNVAAVDDTEATCSGLSGMMVGQQLKVCEDNPHAIHSVSLGARLGLIECQFQFQYDRWNCSLTADNNLTIFDYVVQKGTKETAFMHAITTAGVVHAVTAACSSGNLTDCSCDMSREGELTVEGWKWGGCSDNVRYGIWFAETFVDAAEKSKLTSTMMDSVRSQVNLHNNEVGRKLMSHLMAQKCRCHGISGSCAVRTCWKSLPNFRLVGDTLRDKYENSVEISPHVTSVLRRREKRMRREPIPETELVYVERSPNYCKYDPQRGILGTRGRECKRTSLGPDSCHSLCCGRGYNTVEVRYVERCHCRFIWCCEVKCKVCETIVDVHTCK